MAGHREVHGLHVVLARKSAEELGHAVVIEAGGGLEQAAQEALSLAVEAVAVEAGRDHRAVMRPDRAQVVADRVVAALFGREGPDAPAAEHVGLQKAPGGLFGQLVAHDARPERVAGVGAQDGGRLQPGLQGQGEKAPVREPEVPVEAQSQLGRLPLERGGPLRLARLAEQARGREPGAVDVALHLHHRDGRGRDAAVGVDDRVARIFPALVHDPRAQAAVVGQVAALVAVDAALNPAERQLDVLSKLTEQAGVPGPGLVALQHDHEERRGVDGAVERHVGNFTPAGQLAHAQLVEDAAGLLVAPCVHLAALVGGQEPQGLLGDGRDVGQHLHGAQEAVSAEERHEPGHAGREVVEPPQGRAQAQQVREALGQDAVEQEAARSHAHDARDPLVVVVAQAVAHVGEARHGRGAQRRLGRRRLAEGDRDAHLGGALGRQCERVAGGVVARRLGPGVEGDRRRAMQPIQPLVAEHQVAVLPGRRRHPAAGLADQAAHGEHVLEARLEGQRQHDARRHDAVVAQREPVFEARAIAPRHPLQLELDDLARLADRFDRRGLGAGELKDRPVPLGRVGHQRLGGRAVDGDVVAVEVAAVVVVEPEAVAALERHAAVGGREAIDVAVLDGDRLGDARHARRHGVRQHLVLAPSGIRGRRRRPLRHRRAHLSHPAGSSVVAFEVAEAGLTGDAGQVGGRGPVVGAATAPADGAGELRIEGRLEGHGTRRAVRAGGPAAPRRHACQADRQRHRQQPLEHPRLLSGPSRVVAWSVHLPAYAHGCAETTRERPKTPSPPKKRAPHPGGCGARPRVRASRWSWWSDARS
ncbi:hypothetical protein D3C72_546710 [compost metagenome]